MEGASEGQLCPFLPLESSPVLSGWTLGSQALPANRDTVHIQGIRSLCGPDLDPVGSGTGHRSQTFIDSFNKDLSVTHHVPSTGQSLEDTGEWKGQKSLP